MMPLQRVRVAESRMRNKLANGPLRVQSNGCFPEYSATCGHTSVAGDMLFSQSILRRCRQTSFAEDMLVSC